LAVMAPPALKFVFLLNSHSHLDTCSVEIPQ